MLQIQCDRGMSGMVWPDDGGTLDQPSLLVEAFQVIAAARAEMKS